MLSSTSGGYEVDASEPPAAEDPMASVGQEHLLPGEEPDSVFVDDAVHWISVYEELLGLTEEFHESRADVSAEATQEADEVDQQALTDREHQYRRRLAFWQQRLRSLQPNPKAPS